MRSIVTKYSVACARIAAALAVTSVAGVVVVVPRAQSRPLVAPQAQAIYQRLLPRIERIRVFDHHAHPAFPDDADVDIAPPPPGATPLRMREDNPETAAAARRLYGFPYADLKGAHRKWLVDHKAALRRRYPGPAYFDEMLNRLGIETSMANRVAMASYLNPARFKWVFFVDCFMFPFDNTGLAANPDLGVYMPLQTKLFRQYAQQIGQTTLPAAFSDYLTLVRRSLEENKRRGGVAVKFEAAYFRSLAFGDPARAAAEAVYATYRNSGVPTADEYRTFQDFIFRHIVTTAGELNLPVHIHTSAGGGDYFNLRWVNVLNLEPIVRDPRYTRTTFVLIHGGYPFDREAIFLASMKNVYLDSSATELMLYPSEFKNVLRRWLEIYPEKVTFGSDAFPYNDALGVEEVYAMGVRTARTALAAAAAEMIAAGEISEPRAIAMARAYLHDTTAQLYASAPSNATPR
jgi:predicted TIM-barrel fold metal-dependent hydrolase